MKNNKIFKFCLFLGAIFLLFCYQYYSTHKYENRIKKEINSILKEEQESKCIKLLGVSH